MSRECADEVFNKEGYLKAVYESYRNGGIKDDESPSHDGPHIEDQEPANRQLPPNAPQCDPA